MATTPRTVPTPRWKILLFAAVLLSGGCSRNGSAPLPANVSPPAPPPAPAPPKPDKTAAALAGIPGMDFSILPAPAQRELATVLTDEFCYCGCPHTLGSCLRQHPECRHARRMAHLAASEAAAGTPGVEIIVALSRYYQSFGAPRATFTLDERSCKGNKEASVTLVEFSDFECPFCAAVVPVLDEVLKARPQVRICYQPFPLSSHPHALPAAQAALFAREHGQFWPMHDLLFANQEQLDRPSLKRLAEQLKLDPAGLDKALAAQQFVPEITASKEAGRASGVDSTPSIFINGRKMTLGLSAEILVHSIDDELEWLSHKNSWATD